MNSFKQNAQMNIPISLAFVNATADQISSGNRDTSPYFDIVITELMKNFTDLSRQGGPGWCSKFTHTPNIQKNFSEIRDSLVELKEHIRHFPSLMIDILNSLDEYLPKIDYLRTILRMIFTVCGFPLLPRKLGGKQIPHNIREQSRVMKMQMSVLPISSRKHFESIISSRKDKGLKTSDAQLKKLQKKINSKMKTRVEKKLTVDMIDVSIADKTLRWLMKRIFYDLDIPDGISKTQWKKAQYLYKIYSQNPEHLSPRRYDRVTTKALKNSDFNKIKKQKQNAQIAGQVSQLFKIYNGKYDGKIFEAQSWLIPSKVDINLNFRGIWPFMGPATNSEAQKNIYSLPLLDSLDEIVKKILALFNTDAFPHASDLITIIILLIAIIQVPGKTTKTLLFAVALLPKMKESVHLARDTIEIFMQLIQDYLSPTPKAQSTHDDVNLLTSLATITSDIMGLNVNKLDLKKAVEKCKNFNTIISVTKNFSSFLEWLSNIFTYLITAGMEVLHYETDPQTEDERTWKELAIKYIKKYGPGSLIQVSDLNDSKEILALYNKGVDIINGTGTSAWKKYRMPAMLEAISSLGAQASINLQAGKTREQPLMIYMYGLPGTGKSTITHPLLNEVYKVLHPGFGDLPPNEIYQLNMGSEFHDSYNNQFATVIDDGFAQDDGKKGAELVAELMKWVSTGAHNLKCADMKLFGKKWVSSEIMLLFHNAPTLEPAALIDPDAYKRRRTIHVELVIVDANIDRYDINNARYIIRNTFTNEPIVSFTYYEFVNYITFVAASREFLLPSAKQLTTTRDLENLTETLVPDAISTNILTSIFKRANNRNLPRPPARPDLNFLRMYMLTRPDDINEIVYLLSFLYKGDNSIAQKMQDSILDQIEMRTPIVWDGEPEEEMHDMIRDILFNQSGILVRDFLDPSAPPTPGEIQVIREDGIISRIHASNFNRESVQKYTVTTLPVILELNRLPPMMFQFGVVPSRPLHQRALSKLSEFLHVPDVIHPLLVNLVRLSPQELSERFKSQVSRMALGFFDKVQDWGDRVRDKLFPAESFDYTTLTHNCFYYASITASSLAILQLALTTINYVKGFFYETPEDKIKRFLVSKFEGKSIKEQHQEFIKMLDPTKPLFVNGVFDTHNLQFDETYLRDTNAVFCENMEEAQAYSDGQQKKNVIRKYDSVRWTGKSQVKPVMAAQASVDECLHKMKESHFSLRAIIDCDGEISSIPLLNGLLFKENMLIVNKHVLSNINKLNAIGIEFTRIFKGETYISLVKMSDMSFYPHPSDEVDLLLIVCSNQSVLAGGGISRYLCIPKDWETNHTRNGMALYNFNNATHQMVTNVSPCERMAIHYPAFEYPHEQTVVYLKGWYGKAVTFGGDCGLPYVQRYTSSGRFILGIHAAANDGNVVVQLLTENLITDIIKTMKISSGTNFIPHHILTIDTKEKGTALPHRSQFKESLIHGNLTTPNTAIAPLKPFIKDNLKISPMYNALNHMVYNNYEFSADALSLTFAYFLSIYGDMGKMQKLPLLTAINGDPGFFDSLELNTGAGYPFNLSQGKSKKRDYFHQIDSAYYPNDYLMSKMEEVYAHMNIVNTCCLKDETISLKKANAGETRLFSVTPLHFVLFGRQLTMDIQKKMQERRLTHPVSVGINVHSSEWKQFMDNMTFPFQEEDIGFLVGDKSKYDMVVPTIFNNMVADFFCYFAGDDEEYVSDLNYFFSQINFSTHIVQNVVFLKFGGNVSGNPLTAVMNSLSNAMMDTYIFVDMLLSQNKTHEEVISILKHDFQVRTYGDDDIIVVNKTKHPYYNMQSLHHAYAKIGIKYTDASKGVPVDEYSTKDDVSYLKRKFVEDRSFTYAPRDLDVVLESLNWIKESTISDSDQLLLNAEAVMDDLVHHGEQIYTEYLRKINVALQNKNIPPLRNNFVHVHARILGFDLPKPKHNAISAPAESFTSSDVSSRNIRSTPGLSASSNHFKQIADNLFTNQPLNTTNEGLITYEDNVGTSGNTHSTSFKVISSYNSDNVCKQLQEEYFLGNIKWTTGMTSLSYNWFTNFNANTKIAALAKHFHRARYNVEIILRPHSTPMHHGRMIVFPDQGVHNNLNAAFMAPHILLSASVPEVTSFFMPMLPTTPWPWSSAPNPKISFLPLGPLSNSSSVDSQTILVSISVKLHDVELFGPMAAQSADAETIQKSQKKILSGVAKGLTTVFDSVENVPIVGGIASAAAPITRALGDIFDLFGLQKPTDISVPTKSITSNGSMLSHSRGIDMSHRFTIDPSATQVTDRSVFGLDTADLEQSLQYLAMQPSYLETITINPASTGIVWNKEVHPLRMLELHSTGNYYPTLLSAIAMEAKYWRGSVKFKILFSSSKFANATVRINWTPTKPTSIPNKDSAQRVSKIIEIVGDQEIDFTVPFEHVYNWCRVGPDGVFSNNGFISMDVISAPISNGNLINSTIVATILVAGGEDIQFASPVTRNYSYSDSPVAAAQSMRDSFSKTFPGLAPSLQCVRPSLDPDEEMTHVNDIFLRPQPTTTFRNPASPFNQWFKYHRKGARVKLLRKNGDSNVYVVKRTDPRTPDTYQGEIIWDPLQPLLEFELPYDSVTPYREGSSTYVHADFEVMKDGKVVTDFASRKYVSCTDDSMFAFLTYPGYMNYASAL